MQTKVKTDSGRSTTKPTRTRTYVQPTSTGKVADTVKNVAKGVLSGVATGSRASMINEIAKTRTPKAQQSLTKTLTPIQSNAVTGSNSVRKKASYSYRGK